MPRLSDAEALEVAVVMKGAVVAMETQVRYARYLNWV